MKSGSAGFLEWQRLLQAAHSCAALNEPSSTSSPPSPHAQASCPVAILCRKLLTCMFRRGVSANICSCIVAGLGASRMGRDAADCRWQQQQQRRQPLAAVHSTILRPALRVVMDKEGSMMM